MITGTISKEDFLAANQAHRNKASRRQLRIALFLVCAGIAAAAAGVHFPGFIIAGAGIGAFVGHLLLSRYILPRQLTKAFKQQVALRTPITYEWDAESISATFHTGKTQRPWSDYLKTIEFDHGFLLYHTECMYELVPKSWFPNSGELQSFRETSRSRYA